MLQRVLHLQLVVRIQLTRGRVNPSSPGRATPQMTQPDETPEEAFHRTRDALVASTIRARTTQRPSQAP
jgi:hypothetical protein